MEKKNYKKLYKLEKEHRETLQSSFYKLRKRFDFWFPFAMIAVIFLVILFIYAFWNAGTQIYNELNKPSYIIYKNDCHNETNWSEECIPYTIWCMMYNCDESFNSSRTFNQKIETAINKGLMRRIAPDVDCFQANIGTYESCSKTEVDINDKKTRVDFICGLVTEIPKEQCKAANIDFAYSHPSRPIDFINESFLDKHCECLEHYKQVNLKYEYQKDCQKYKCGKYEVIKQ